MKIINIITAALLFFTATGCKSNDIVYTPDDNVIPAHTDGGYLFAFMTNARYGKLHYALSRDGFNWETLNSGRVIDTSYKGHPDIIQGHDGAYYMIAVEPLALWRSEDMTSWSKTRLDESIFSRCSEIGYYVANSYVGAPKLFWDETSGQYMITYHVGRTPGKEDWDTIDTLYILTKDFKTFTAPQKLFNFTGEWEGLKTIDTIIRKIGSTYYAITKDERPTELAPETGKCIVICKADNPTGPYTNPVVRVTPNDMYREAPIFIERPGNAGYAVYAESYVTNPLSYHMFVAADIEGVWTERTFLGPNVKDGSSRPGARHGCMVRIPENVYQALNKTFSVKQ